MPCPYGIFSLAPQAPSVPRSTPASPPSFPRPKESLAAESSISINRCSISGGIPSDSAKFTSGAYGNNPPRRNRPPTPKNCSRKNNLPSSRHPDSLSIAQRNNSAQLSAFSVDLVLPP